MKKLIRITTVPISLEKLLENQLAFMSDFFEVVAVSSEKERLEALGRKEGVRTYFINLTRTISPLKDLLSLWKMYRFLSKEKPQIVHSHTPKAGTIGMIAAKFARVPHRLHTVAGLPLMETTGMKRKLLNFVEKITYWSATKVYPNSHGLLEIIVKEGFCKPEKLKVIANGSSNGINTKYFDPSLFDSKQKESLRNSLSIQANDFVFIFVGRLVSDKGINELVSAFNQVCLEHSSTKLILVGEMESELDPLNKETIDKINSLSNIVPVGFQNDVRPYLSIADALVFPSYREGFPNVVMQAGAMGLPSIVSDINGCNEMITEGLNGKIIPSKNVDSLTNAILSFLTEPIKTKEMARNARSVIQKKYEQNVVWNALLEEYKSMFENNNGNEKNINRI